MRLSIYIYSPENFKCAQAKIAEKLLGRCLHLGLPKTSFGIIFGKILGQGTRCEILYAHKVTGKFIPGPTYFPPEIRNLKFQVSFSLYQSTLAPLSGPKNCARPDVNRVARQNDSHGVSRPTLSQASLDRCASPVIRTIPFPAKIALLCR